MAGKAKSETSYIFVAAIIILSIALAAESFAISSGTHLGNLSTISKTSTIAQVPTSDLNITLTASKYSVVKFAVTVSGNGFNESQYAKLGPKLYALNSSVSGVRSVSGPITISSNAELNRTVVIPDNETNMLFTGLKPYSNYTVTVKGSESPYCFPGLACPMFILAISRTYELRTGPLNSTANYSISLSPEPYFNSTTTYDGCSISLPTAINQSSYTICNDGSRLLNFVLSQVNLNGTITGLVYPYYGAISNATVRPLKQVFHDGQEVVFSCSGYVAYLHNASYAGQYAIFKVTRTRPIPCPAEVG
ncbi:hypothetical protein M1567_00345 [Candidatus Marsarchaeota archaeon]|nr:hypothetical protein [Candidatus Marsarchaeota archaeon]